MIFHNMERLSPEDMQATGDSAETGSSTSGQLNLEPNLDIKNTTISFRTQNLHLDLLFKLEIEEFSRASSPCFEVQSRLNVYLPISP